MVCQRCRGLLVRETFDDLRQEMARDCPATRCINCGCLEDPVMRANRLCFPPAKRAVPHRRIRKGGVVFVNAYSEKYGSYGSI
jgi:hypothetical protein